MTFKKNILGVDVDIEFDFWDSIDKTIQKIYEFKLWMVWRKNIYLKNRFSFEFVKYALKQLPNGSFVIFDFDASGVKFVQFANLGEKITLDIPIWITNEFFNHEADLKKIFTNLGIKKASIRKIRIGKEKYDINVSFENHYTKAAKIAFLICNEIYSINEPCVFDYKTSNLVRKPKSE